MNRLLNPDKELQAYVIGLALGDGNLSKIRKTIRLRISCDTKYPILLEKIKQSLQKLFPKNKVNTIQRKSNCVDVYLYSNFLENLLGWKAKGGSKFVQKVFVPSWVKENNNYKINCLRGLVETDGCIYNDREYKMMIFKSIIPNLAQDFYTMMTDLGFTPRLYKIKPKKNNLYQFNQQVAYQVRLSKNVYEFLTLVKPEKM